VKPEVGMVLEGRGPDGKTFAATVHEIGDDSIKLNFNHPLAGKTLHFKVKVVSIALAQA
jgi:FKBP-type peptidyl-prolyl cis-trans isomerase 2